MQACGMGGMRSEREKRERGRGGGGEKCGKKTKTNI